VVGPVSDEPAFGRSPGLRTRHAGQIEVLDRVKTLPLPPGGTYVTVELAAAYFEVTGSVIEEAISRHLDELVSDGLQVLTGERLSAYRREHDHPAQATALTLLPRRAVLRLGMLLPDSPVARLIRERLLDVERPISSEEHPAALARAAEAQLRVLRLADGLVDRAWLAARARHVAARALGEEPDLDPQSRPLTVGEYLADKGLSGQRLRTLSPTFGKRIKTAYRARHDADPPTVERFVDGALRRVAGYTEADRPLFDQAWQELIRQRSAA
jgi:hypothetical protein